MPTPRAPSRARPARPKTGKRQSRPAGVLERAAHVITELSGSTWAFLVAAGVVAVWAISGPLFGFSDTWQLVINTGTTIITFLMVFLIQNTQNRDSHAVQLKLDELIRAVSGAHNALLDLEELEEADLERFRVRYEELARAAREALGRGELDTGTPELKPE
jgi:low affinity Fe/Cu permease